MSELDSGSKESRYGFCCSPVVMGFWAGIFLTLWGSSLLLPYWYPAIDLYSQPLLFASAGIACVATFLRYRAFHCAITGPALLLVAGALGLNVEGSWFVDTAALWPVLLIVIGVSVLMELRFIR